MARLLAIFALLSCLAVSDCQSNSSSNAQGALSPVQANSSSSGPAPQNASQGTNPTDLSSLNILRNRLSLTASQIAQLRWDTSADPCGNSSCPMAKCTWNGIACRNWRIVAVDVSSGVISNMPLLVVGMPPAELANLTKLESLNISGHSLSGPLPVQWSSLSNLQYLDMSYNGFTGTLPPQWANMSSLVTLSLAHNSLQGAAPQAWAQLSNLRVLDLRANGICQSSFLSSNVLVMNDNSISCASKQIFASTAPVAAPGSSAAASSVPSPTPTSNPSQSSPSPFQAPQPPILQMSTGINIAVSVVIGAFLLFGIVAGAVRVRRQQHAHRIWLSARMEALRRTEREDEDAFQRHLKTLVPPKLVIDPTGQEISIACCLGEGASQNDQSSNNGYGDHPASAGTSPVPAQVSARSMSEVHVGEDALPATAAGRSQAEEAASRSPRPPGSPRPPSETQLAHELRLTPGSQSRSPEGRGRARIKKLPMFIINAYLTPSGAITFDPDEAAAATAKQDRSWHVAVSVQEEASPSQPGVSGGIRGLWANLRGGREGTTDVEANRAASTSAQAGPSISRAASTGLLTAGSIADPRAASITAPVTQDPSVAARVRERIDQLRDVETSPPTPALEGPAPPPPVIRWGALRRFLGMEDEAAREARLRREAEQVAVVNSVAMVDRSRHSASAAGGSRHPDTSRRSNPQRPTA